MPFKSDKPKRETWEPEPYRPNVKKTALEERLDDKGETMEMIVQEYMDNRRMMMSPQVAFEHMGFSRFTISRWKRKNLLFR